MKLHPFFLIALPLVTSLSGCGSFGSACTEIGCENGYTLDFQAASGSWPAGSYQVDITADGAQITCTATLPLTSTSIGACTSDSVALDLAGSAQPPAEQMIIGLRFTKDPTSVKVTVSRDGAMVVSQDFTPKYTTSMPNGPDCEPTCTSAHDTLTVP